MPDDKRNAINRFAIPTADFERGRKFYETIIGGSMHTMKMGDRDMAFFPMDDGKAGGVVIFHKDAKPSPEGTMAI